MEGSSSTAIRLEPDQAALLEHIIEELDEQITWTEGQSRIVLELFAVYNLPSQRPGEIRSSEQGRCYSQAKMMITQVPRQGRTYGPYLQLCDTIASTIDHELDAVIQIIQPGLETLRQRATDTGNSQDFYIRLFQNYAQDTEQYRDIRRPWRRATIFEDIDTLMTEREWESEKQDAMRHQLFQILEESKRA